MNTKTMEGLVGASTNMNLLDTPFRVYKEARQKGDTGAMERAMGYVGEFSDKAEKYKTEANEGMKEDAKEAREKAESERENMIRKRREEHQEFEKRMEENKSTDTVEISETSKALLKDNGDLGSADLDSSVSAEIKTDTVKTEPVIYTKAGEVTQSNMGPGTSISVSV